ncbi:MAG: LPS export ABC transporter ATP-binding protein [Deltaproteobacteria bacterium]|nr:MAG: LPS export ABC transporter ATP-binding protein [Deltaproteobacteria bacterium]TMB31708.1 MAG: LPS export ABC transporter ATP-binding protein [Deltaproteobacteria bacterium]
MNALVAKGLAKSFRGRRVVDGVSFEVRPGEVVGLLGPNGAGKTTSFHCVVGLLKPDEGEVLLGGKDLSGLPLHRRARMGLGYLPQEDSIFRKLSVRDNLLVVLEGHGVKGRDARDKADEVLTEFELLRVADSLGETLSGGERRRAEIARSLVSEPRFLLFDEPFAGIDPIAVHELQRLIGGLKQRGLGVLITDHAVRETLGICDRAVLLVEGRLLETGTPAEIAASERARAVYLGERFKLE